MVQPTPGLSLAQIQQWLFTDGLYIVAVIVLALLVRWLLARAIRRVVASMTEKSRRDGQALRKRSGGSRVLYQATGMGHQRQVQRVSTLASLLRSVGSFVITVVTILTIMAIIGLPLGPILASAGVGGVALGFGAQTLVKDFLSGVFMIFEDQYGVGDVIDAGPAVGTVEEVGLRITRLRDDQGVIWYVRNGEVNRVGNHSQGGAVEKRLSETAPGETAPGENVEKDSTQTSDTQNDSTGNDSTGNDGA